MYKTKPEDANHVHGCQHTSSPIWLCECPRPPISTIAADIVERLRDSAAGLADIDEPDTIENEAADFIEYQTVVIDSMKEGLEKTLITIQAGLCYFTSEAKHCQLKDAEKEIQSLIRMAPK